MKLSKIITSIPALDPKAMEKAAKRQAQLTKPAGSLGRLESIAIQVAGITGREIPPLGKKQIILCAADHGVVAEGVSAFPQAVTPMMVLNFLNGGAAINALAKQVGAEVKVVDVGVAADLPRHKQLLSAKIAKGTKNFKTGPAMSEAECAKALELGVRLADQAKREKVTFVVLGEMGIGNTTSASALMAALLPCAVEDVTGFGTGIDRTQWMNKCRVILESHQLHLLKPEEPLEALRKVGGLEIAALTGVVLGCAKNRIPIVVDGFITSSAFLVAYRLNPRVKDFAFFSHRSEEPGHTKFYEMLGVEPLLEMKMRLGEGSGGALALNILEAAVRVHAEMATFESAKVPTKTQKRDEPRTRQKPRRKAKNS
ncbi:MAG TPA: nicotinate-nucleotide--dimethylbenzimidazole phosphoribosyltransferase [bacterium]|jgi:nicotinate-nucleotide--dimethylbenzimidazole phosphoribosyltransferase|nr:nicotinate-nucleotide--dimethylbenzimidazole phosphoribosyltransferase [bacterium]